MAFKAAIREEQFAAAASITISAYPRTPVAGDTIIIALSNDLGTTVISTATSGWTMIGTQAAAAAHNCGVAWAKYSGGVPTLPTFSGTNATWNACIIIIPDAASSPIGGYQRFHLGAEYSHDSNSVAYSSAGGTTPFTASSKSLLLYVASCDGANLGSIRFKAADVTSDAMMQTLDSVGNALSTLIVGHRHIETGATVPACTLYSNINSEGGPCWVIEILNATGGSTQPDARTGIEEKFWYGNFQTAAAPGGAITWESLVPLLEHAGVGPNGLKVSDLTGTTTNGVVSVNGEWGSRTQISCTRNIEAAFGAGVHAWVGAKHTFSAVDLRGVVAVLDWDISGVSTSRQGEEGQIMFFGDASNNYVAFQLRPRAGTASSQRTYQTRVALGDSESAEIYASSGALDWQNVTQFGVAYDRFSTATGATALEIRNLCFLTSTSIVSGGENKPATFSAIVDSLGSWGILGAANLQSAKQVLLIGDVQIGDGTNPVHFDSSGEALGVPAEWVSARYSDWNAAANTRTISIKTTASDTVLMRAGSIVTPVAQSLVIDATAVAPAEFSVAGEVCLGLGASTWHSDFSPTGMTYQDSGLLDGKAATFTGCYFTNGTDSSGQLKLADGGGALSCVFTQGGSALYAIKIDAAGDYYINGSTFSSGYTKHINITATSGTVTIYKDAGDATPTYDTAGATVVIDTPSPTLSATVLADTRVVLYNRTTDAELDNAAPVGTSWSKVITSGASSGDVLDLYTFKEGYTEAVATIIYSGSDASFAVQQETDDAIQYYRTQESVTDYTTLTEYNFYSPDIYIQADDADGENTLKRLFIFYNGVLTTEDGARYMRGGVTFRSPFDVVINRSVVAMAIDNVSTTQGLHFTDEDTIRVTTDDGSSWIAPPSAPGSIRYAFGVSPGQIETTGSSVITGSAAEIIAAIPSAATIANEVVNVVTFP